MNFMFLILLSIVNCYKYLTLYNWKVVKKILSDGDNDDKYNIKQHIYNDYKTRTFIKVKKILKKKNILNNNNTYELKYFYFAGLLGLKESINTYDSNKKINFAKYTDKYIEKKLKKVFNYLEYVKEYKHEKYYKCWKPYWIYINNELHPTYANMLKLKYSYDFKEKKKNYELAIIYNTSLNNITEIITSSLTFIYKKIKNENLLGEYFFTDKIYF